MSPLTVKLKVFKHAVSVNYGSVPVFNNHKRTFSQQEVLLNYTTQKLLYNLKYTVPKLQVCEDSHLSSDKL